jgi:hypothetical protein
MGQQIADQAHRAGVAARGAAPAGHKRSAVDRAWMGHDDARLRDLECSVLTTATAHHTTTRSWLRTVPGIGELLRLVRLDAIPASHRCPRVQDVVSSGRLVTCATASAGTRDGPGGRTSGQADRTGAFSDAAGRCWRGNPSGQQSLTRVEKQHGKGTAVTSLAQHVTRAVSGRFKRPTAFAINPVLHG